VCFFILQKEPSRPWAASFAHPASGSGDARSLSAAAEWRNDGGVMDLHGFGGFACLHWFCIVGRFFVLLLVLLVVLHRV